MANTNKSRTSTPSAQQFFTLYVGNLLLPLMGEDFLWAAFAELGPDVAEMLHSISVHLNPVRPAKLIKGFAFINFTSSSAAQAALTAIMHGVWANNAADFFCLAKTRMIVTPVAAKPHDARAKLSVTSLAKTVDEATLASAFAACPGFRGQQVLRDYNPFGSPHMQQNQGIEIPNCYGKTQTGPLGRAYVYFETAAHAAHALRTMNNAVIDGMPIRLQRPRNNKNVNILNGQTKQLVMPTALFTAPAPPVMLNFMSKPMLNPAAVPFYPANHWAGNSMKAAAATVFAADTVPAFSSIAAHRGPFWLA